MRRLLALLLLLLAVHVEAASSEPLAVRLDRETIAVGAGERFSFSSTVTGSGSRLVVHLNIASVDPETYVDPEDWSSERTRYVDVLASEGSRHDWSMQAVGSGEFVVYVAVAQSGGAGPVVASAPLRLTVAQRQTLGAASALPVALSVPGVLLVLVGALARRRRHLR